MGKSESDTKYPDWATTQAKKALVDFGLSDEVDPEFIYETIQHNKNHGWAEDQTGMKERALAQALRRALPDGYDHEDLVRLIAFLKEHDEYR